MGYESTEPIRFTSLEEVRLKPYPIRPIPARSWNPDVAKAIWKRMNEHPWMLSDNAKGQFDQMMKATVEGKIHWFELGRGLGLAHVYGIQDGIGLINVEFFGNKREFLKLCGKSKECREIWIEAIMKWLKLRKLKAFVLAENKASQRLVERCGFVREGWLRQEWIVNGKPEDVYVYGILKEEVR